VAGELSVAAILAAIRAAEQRMYETIDLVVDELLVEPGAEFWRGDVSGRWRELDPIGWHDERYSAQVLARWLRAADDRGELVGEMRRVPKSGFPRKYYRRPEVERAE